jgi:hypothetical protein
MAVNMNDVATNTQDLNDLMHLFNSDDNTNDNPLELLDIKSDYYEINDINATIPRGANFQYKTIHINIQSLPDKFDKLKLFLHRLKDESLTIDFVLICETFLTDKNANMYQIPGYKFIHKSRSIISRGGVGMYVRDNIQFKLRDDIALFYEGQFESIFIETTHSSKTTIIGEIYRIPSANDQLSLDRFEAITDQLHKCNTNIIMGTDQNFDYLKFNSHNNTAELLNNFFSHGRVPYITKPMQITLNTTALIDNHYKRRQNRKIKTQ